MGTTAFYRVRDPLVFELLDVARRIFNNHLIDTRTMLEQLGEEEAEKTPKRERESAQACVCERAVICFHYPDRKAIAQVVQTGEPSEGGVNPNLV